MGVVLQQVKPTEAMSLFTAPTIQIADQTLTGGEALLRYVADLHHEELGNYYPDPTGSANADKILIKRQKIDSWIEFCESELQPPLRKVLEIV